MAADLAGVSNWQVSKWWQRNSIPPEYWSLILRTEEAREAGLSADDLTSLAADTLVEARA
jgi:hypothetical protein